VILRRLLLICGILWASFAIAADIPYLTGRINDHAGILSDGMRRSLTEQLKAHEDRTSNQIVVLTIPSLEGESIEEYAASVFKAWKLGQKGKDNGILLVIVPNDRRMRIEVGYGLEEMIPDSLAGSIIRNGMTPKFKTGNYNGGIEAGVKAIINILEGNSIPDSLNDASSAPQKQSGFHINVPDMPLIERILIGAFVFGIIGLFTVIGVVTPGVGWFLYVFLIPFWAMFPVIIVGTTGALYLLITYLVLFPISKLVLKNTAWYQQAQKKLRTKGHASIGGFMISSGSSGGGWSSGSSGFSGGGGSSGGGGASGGW